MKKLLATVFALSATPAFAHHPLAGAPMETFTHGLLSGVGHPLLGFDHLFFVIAIGIAAAYTGRALLAPMGYVVGMLGGIGLILGGVALPAVEVVIALSLLIAGGILMAGRRISMALCLGLFSTLGLFHGWAFGESLTAQEAGVGAGVIIGYLLGLAVIQWAIAVAAGWLARRFGETTAHMAPRLSGAMVAGIGLFLVMEAAEGAAFAALGLG
ncbi:MAG: HupE/UreJ family protein [Pseudomonadota bacterium]